MKIHETHEDRIVNTIFYILLAVLTLIFTYPLWFIIIASVSSPDAIWGGNVVLLPSHITLLGYKKIFVESRIWIGYRNSLIYMVVGTLVNLAVTVAAAYPLSRRDFKARNFCMAYFVITMFFSGGMIPTYLIIQKLGIIDTLWVMVLPGAVNVTNIIITRTFFQNTIPTELHEAGMLDGCTNFRFFLRVVLPLSSAIIAVMTLFFAVGHWNSYFNALLYLNSRDRMPLQMFLREILTKSQISNSMSTADMIVMGEQYKLSETIKYGVIIVACLPVMIMFPFIQKHFVKGVMIGSLKG